MVEIDLVIKMGEDCEKRMSLDDARDLFINLGNLFEGNRYIYGQQSPFNQSQASQPVPTYHPEVEAARKAAGVNTGGSGGCGCGKKKVPVEVKEPETVEVVREDETPQVPQEEKKPSRGRAAPTRKPRNKQKG